MNRIIFKNNKNNYIFEIIIIIIFIFIFVYFIIYLNHLQIIPGGFKQKSIGAFRKLQAEKFDNVTSSPENSNNNCSCCGGSSSNSIPVIDQGIETVNKDSSSSPGTIKFKKTFIVPPKIFVQIVNNSENPEESITVPTIQIIEKSITTSEFQYVVRAVSNKTIGSNKMKVLGLNNNYYPFSFHWMAIGN